ncbi:hypothetical protein [Domibacillus antri]|uniref:hypothetical protein n=1 Tax=Domibacillus antri TaxID=1714264 RepID=UPI000AABFF72|nr:hypothetical protein [Domibacillus antri]
MFSFQTIGQFIIEKNIDLSGNISQKLAGDYTAFLNKSGLEDESLFNMWGKLF